MTEVASLLAAAISKSESIAKDVEELLTLAEQLEQAFNKPKLAYSRTRLAALSEQRQVVCVGLSKRRPKLRLGREGAPLGQRGGAPLFVNLAGDEMALLIEMVVDLGMN